jgi:hypothetical protein
MARGIYLVFSKPVSPERDAEYNEWYDNVHVPDCLKVPGWMSATRYVRSDAGGPQDSDPLEGRRYLTVYDFEAASLGDPLDAVKTVSAQGAIKISDAIEMKPRPLTVLFERL